MKDLEQQRQALGPFDFDTACQLHQLLTDYAVYCLTRRLDELGVLESLSCDGSASKVIEQHSIEPTYHQLIHYLVTYFSESDDAKPSLTAEGLAERILDIDPRLATTLKLIARCAEHLWSVVTGETKYVEVLFPGGSIELVKGFYADNLLADWYQEQTAQAVEQLVAKASQTAGQPLQLIEIGAGSGASTEWILDRLRPYAERIHYTFTDVSPIFPQLAKRQFADFSNISFRALDITKPLAEQGIELGAYDLVIAANVLHATPKLAETLEQLACLSKPQGHVVINEVMTMQFYHNIVFGLTDGWWAFDDDLRQPFAPLIAHATWQQSLSAHQFELTETLAFPGESGDYLQAVMVATNTVATNKTATNNRATNKSAADQALKDTSTTPASDGHADILIALTDIVHKVSWIEPAELVTDRNLFELGIDSLMLTTIRQHIKRDFELDIPVSEFYQQLDTLDKLAGFVAEHRSTSQKDTVSEPAVSHPAESKLEVEQALEKAAPMQTPPVPPIGERNTLGSEASDNLSRIMQQQLQGFNQLCQQQLATLQGMSSAPATVEGNEVKKSKRRNLKSAVNVRSFKLAEDKPLTPQQQAFVQRLVEHHVQRTPSSKNWAQQYRTVMADWINSLGFRLALKEMMYPMISKQSQGARFIDLDGNEYIDMAMGYGVHFFGHRPDFVVDALTKQLGAGVELGPQQVLAGEVALLVSELTGVERVTFSNTGTEAVMTAVKLARGVTKRDKIVIFANSYHGTFDGVLAVNLDGETHPMTIGTPYSLIEDVIVLNYGNEESFAQIEQYKDELAAVLVEPVQSRRPSLQPKAFLKGLRELTQKLDIALIFDETITGFRTCSGGAQQYFGIEADLVIYGKAVGGSMPLSLVCGKRRYMDAIDGGSWQYGDDSHPSRETIFFGGTYVKHPLALAAAKAGLEQIKEQGDALYQRLEALMNRLVTGVNDFFKQQHVPMKMVHFSTMFRFESFGQYAINLEPIELDLFFQLLIQQGIYTWERRICFLSTAHSEDDVEQIILAVKKAIMTMRAGGFAFSTQSESPALLDELIYQPLFAPQPYLASAAQKRMFIVSKLDNVSTTYNLAFGFHISGPFDGVRAQQALNALVKRHESVRVKFCLAGDQVKQSPIAELAIPLPKIITLAQDIDQEAAAFVQPFDLEQGPLIRAQWLVVSDQPQQSVLLFDMHHIVADGLSLNQFVQEFIALYTSDAPLTPLSHRFSEFVSAEQQYLASEQAQQDLNYWLERFEGFEPSLNLPVDRSRPARQDFSGDNLYFTLDAKQTEQLKRAAQQHKVSLFMWLFTHYSLLLHKLSGATDMAIAVPSAGRHSDDFNHVIGMFANTTVMRQLVDPAASVSELVDQTMLRFLTDMTHERYPFEAYLAHLPLEKDTSRNPLFDVMFIFEKADDRVMQMEGLDIAPYHPPNATAPFDLTLEVIECQGELQCRIQYATALFEHKTIGCFADYYQNLLAQTLDNSDQQIADLLVTPPAYLDSLLAEKVIRQEQESLSLVEVFQQQVQQHSDDIALEAADGDRTFMQLQSDATAIAKAIVALQSQAGRVIGICMGRNSHLVSAIWGSWLSGNIYLPLDPDYPAERLAYIIENSGADVILSDSAHQGFIEQLVDESDLSVEIINAEQLAPTHAVTLPEPDPNQTAYMIYTSGSTGKPKGICVGQQALLDMSLNLSQRFGCQPGMTMLALTTVSFDISILELVSATLAGMDIRLATKEQAQDPFLLREHLIDRPVNVVQATPSRMNLICECLGRQWLENVQIVLVGGEAMDGALFEQLRLATPAVFNVYGPSETCIWSTSAQLNQRQQLSIGTPLHNEAVMVVDAKLNILPPGIAGELVILGTGLAEGYWQRQQLTAEKFADNPYYAPHLNSDGFVNETQRMMAESTLCHEQEAAQAILLSSPRLYRTGDLARQLPNGEFLFLGRLDDQVKIRGYRVELGEVEAAILALPMIERVAVTAISKILSNDDKPLAEKELAAFVVTTSDEPDHDLFMKLGAMLEEVLPEYMIPTQWRQYAKLPLTPNGKVDKKRLVSELHTKQRHVETQKSQPQNEARGGSLANSIVAVFREVLKSPSLGFEDNFFRAGGDSIKAIQAATQLQELAQASGLEPASVSDIFKCKTAAAIAESMQASSAGAMSQAVEPLPIEPEVMSELKVLLGERLDDNEIEQAYPLTPLQEGMLFHHLMAPDSTAYIEQMHLSFHRSLSTEWLQKAWQQVVERYGVLRTHFVMEELEQPLQVVMRKGAVDFRHVALTADFAAGLEALQQAEKQRVFDLQNDALMRVTVVTHADKPNQCDMIWTFHHIILDGWSIGLVLNDFFQCVEALSGGLLPKWSANAPQYAQFIAWLNAQDQNNAVTQWTEYLDGLPQPSLIGRDKAFEPNAAVTEIEKASFILEQHESQKLMRLAKSLGVTLNAINQVVWGLLLSENQQPNVIDAGENVAGAGDVVFAATVSGRPASLTNADNIVGLLINAIPVRVRWTAEDTFAELVERVTQQQGELTQFHYASLADIQAQVAPQQALFDHIFMFENFPLQDSLLAGVNNMCGIKDVNDIAFSENTHYGFDISITATPQLSVQIKYDSQRFAKQWIEQLLARWRQQLLAIIAEPNVAVSTLVLPVLNESLIVLQNSVSSNSVSQNSVPQNSAGSKTAPAKKEKMADLSQQVLDALRQVIQRQDLGLDDNFFQAGGHSLKAVRAINAIAKTTGIRMPLKAFYEAGSAHAIGRWLQAHADNVPVQRSITAVPKQKDYPLSNAQMRLWLWQSKHPEVAAYNTMGAYQLSGDLDLTCLQFAWQQLVERHEILRTRFTFSQGEIRQQVLDGDKCEEIDIEYTDLSHELMPEKACREQVQQASLQPFALDDVPLFRVLVYRLGRESYVVAYIFHHIISDAWSDAVLARECSAFYNAAINGKQLSLAPLSFHYKDYACWQQQMLTDKQMAEHATYWARQFTDVPEALELATDRPRPEQRQFSGKRLAFSLADELSQKLHDLATTHQVSLFSCLLASIKVLLAHLDQANIEGNRDIVTGVPIANREQEGLDDQIGFYLNMLPIRHCINDEQSFQGLVAALNQQLISSYQHQSYPLDALVESLELPVDKSRNPLFDVMVILHSNDPVAFDFDGVTTAPFYEDSYTSRYDLDFEFYDGETLSGFVEYDTALFDKARIEQIIGLWQDMLAFFLADPNAALKQFVSLKQRSSKPFSSKQAKAEKGDEAQSASLEQEHFLQQLNNIDEDF